MNRRAVQSASIVASIALMGVVSFRNSMFAIAPHFPQQEVWAPTYYILGDIPDISNIMTMNTSVSFESTKSLPRGVASRSLTNTTNMMVDVPTTNSTHNNQLARPDIEYYQQMLEYNNTALARMRNISSVDYFACCGLGHRLTKNVDAYYLASRVLNFSLRVHWSYCDDGDRGRHEVSQYLFGPQPPTMVEQVISTDLALLLRNDLKGFRKIVRDRPAGGECMCPKDDNKYWSDVEYYRSLRDRFRLKSQVDEFVKSRFEQFSVIGIHVRAGNNETGDFIKKHRIIEHRDQWVQNVVKLLANLTDSLASSKNYSNSGSKPPLLYIATDTPSMVGLFSAALRGIMPVVEFPQRRPPENEGVSFGGSRHVQKNGSDCLLNWENVVMDMMLLSHADVIVAARPSSFSQSLPMALAYARAKGSRIYPKPFCEVNYNATAMRCYTDFQDWCCEGEGKFALSGLNQRYEYLRIPPTNILTKNYTLPSSIKRRPRRVRREVYENEFLPYEYNQS